MAHTDTDDLVGLLDADDQNLDIPATLPMLPVRDVVVFTHMIIPLFVGRDKSVRAVDAAMAKDRFLFLATQMDGAVENPESDQIFKHGTAARILRVLKLPDGRVKVLVQGLAKAKIVRYTKKSDMFRVRIELLHEEDLGDLDMETEALMRNVKESCEKILGLRGELTPDVTMVLDGIDHPGRLADLVASNLNLKIEEAQSIFETIDPVQRLLAVNGFVSREVELSAMQARIQSSVRDEISKSQKDYFLREQMRAINRELGEMDEKTQEIKEYQDKIRKAKMPKEAKEEAERQLKRLEQMHPEAGEAPTVRTYLDWLVEVPWKKATKDTLDIKKAKEILEEDHYGLEKVKDRILEYLAVRKLNPKMKGPILCFVGPPGVGKTSLGKSIARAMGRKFYRLSLGGIRDEAEIRGHRRTYIGALPGRIIQGLKHCKSNNPVFMMDEIDKIGADFRGDPSSALLEALDPEQNFAFSDHYLNVPFDLSSVMFITTANMTDTIPSALLDRMEVINLAGYTENEKVLIAQQYLVPRQVKENGLKPEDITISGNALLKMATEYTSESGLRNLEREIGTLCRKVSRKIAEGKKGPYQITASSLVKYLGLEKFLPEMDQEEPQIGLATGLAWTHWGGEALYIETTLMRGKGELVLTGQLGEVMQESARAALSYARTNEDELEIDPDLFDNFDIHIHVPAGAIPKDGPSAGIAMTTALVSALTERPVANDIAMTGEVTIRGRVLPIGGLREKSLGALRAGIKTIIIPEKNKKELSEVPQQVRRKLKYITVSHVNEVLEKALLPAEKKKAPPKKKPPKKAAKPKAKKTQPKAKTTEAADK
ncbi:ATP-dependent protease La [Desulfatibacillum aliphaticivorans]|uniref:Lon protease n=1 Tax=Desulfatibacillum aliphaticivorans TaxID=218208 RepID=LON_DESAL|nr:endopeptidase La [Desulfatibacillum aliphaticivorans]B8F9K1.1 RecName: Full=Lon protease; AltName: Full=ATP-dependent protease La [Desulfatibacillum aliphaticivorans]ACL02947.1 ATP-dependent protease La [Desulfatibacillum aliphaticivorans]